MEWSRRVEYHIFLIYQKLTVQDFNFQLFGILRVSTLRFGGSPLLLITFYSNLSGRGVSNAIYYRVGRKYLNPWCGISTSWDMPIKICMAILIDKMQLSREFKGYRCNMKKIIEPSFSWFLYRFLVVCIWDFGLLKVKGHSHKMAKVTKKIFTGPKN